LPITDIQNSTPDPNAYILAKDLILPTVKDSSSN